MTTRNCPQCHKTLGVPDDVPADAVGTCPYCNSDLTIADANPKDVPWIELGSPKDSAATLPDDPEFFERLRAEVAAGESSQLQAPEVHVTSNVNRFSAESTDNAQDSQSADENEIELDFEEADFVESDIHPEPHRRTESTAVLPRISETRITSTSVGTPLATFRPKQQRGSSLGCLVKLMLAGVILVSLVSVGLWYFSSESMLGYLGMASLTKDSPDPFKRPTPADVPLRELANTELNSEVDESPTGLVSGNPENVSFESSGQADDLETILDDKTDFDKPTANAPSRVALKPMDVAVKGEIEKLDNETPGRPSGAENVEETEDSSDDLIGNADADLGFSVDDFTVAGNGFTESSSATAETAEVVGETTERRHALGGDFASVEVLTEAFQDAVQANETWDNTDGSDLRLRRLRAKAWQEAIGRLAQQVTYADMEDPDMSVPVDQVSNWLAKLVQDRAKGVFVAHAGFAWMSRAQRTTDGVCLRGELANVRDTGDVVQATLQVPVPKRGDVEVGLVCSREAAAELIPSLAGSTSVILLGIVVDDPQGSIPGYDGRDEPIVWAGPIVSAD